MEAQVSAGRVRCSSRRLPPDVVMGICYHLADALFGYHTLIPSEEVTGTA